MKQLARKMVAVVCAFSLLIGTGTVPVLADETKKTEIFSAEVELTDSLAEKAEQPEKLYEEKNPIENRTEISEVMEDQLNIGSEANEGELQEEEINATETEILNTVENRDSIEEIESSTSNVQFDDRKMMLSDDYAASMVGASYGSYDGVDYTRLTSNSKRLAALNKAKKMVTIQWQSPATFVTWSSSKGAYNTVTAMDGTSAKQYIAGKMYQGIPYSMINHLYDDERWSNLLSTNGITTSSMTGRLDSYPASGTAKGIDCSRFVFYAIKAAGYTGDYENTNSMLNSSYWTKISKSSMEPGDVFLKSGHVMMYVGMAGSKYAIFEATAEGSKTRYHEYSSSQLSAYSAYTYTGYGSSDLKSDLR